MSKEHNQNTCGCACVIPNAITTCMGICYFNDTCPPSTNRKICDKCHEIFADLKRPIAINEETETMVVGYNAVWIQEIVSRCNYE